MSFKKQPNLRKTILNNSGFSLVEIMVAAGLIGIVALGAMNLAGQLNQVQHRSEDFLERNDLISTFTRYIYSTKGCDDLIDQTVSSTPSPINFPSWTFGGVSGLSGGSTFYNNQLTITELNATQDVSAALPRVKVGANTYVKTSLDIELVITQNGRARSHFYNLPVLSTNAGQIKLCNENKSAAEVCSAMLGTWNPTTNTCDVADSCLLKGTYKTLECSPVPGSGCSLDHGPDENNPYTGATSCPTGSTATQTGIVNWNHTVSCGKKCSQTIANTARWFSCLDCP